MLRACTACALSAAGWHAAWLLSLGLPCACRRIRLAHPKVQAQIVDVSGALEFLEGTGFLMHFEEASGAAPAADGAVQG